MRDYHRNPVQTHARRLWEFQAVTSGCISPTGLSSAGDGGGFRSDSLWLFRPEESHGWTGEPDQPATISVFHFDEVPAEFERIIGPAGWTVVALDSESTGVMRDLTRLAERYFGDASIMAELSSRVIANRLAMIAYGASLGDAESRRKGRGELTVSRAESILDAEAERLVTVGELAQRVGTSVATLRRFFALYRGYPPQHAREQYVMHRARRELARGCSGVMEVALLCGYTSHSAFTRAYRRFWNESPRSTQERGSA